MTVWGLAIGVAAVLWQGPSEELPPRSDSDERRASEPRDGTENPTPSVERPSAGSVESIPSDPINMLDNGEPLPRHPFGPPPPTVIRRVAATRPMPPGLEQPPVPRVEDSVRDQISVGLGLAPEAPGSKEEARLVARLEQSVAASTNPVASAVRRIAPGAGDGRRICRQGRDDVVLLIGYVASRPEPVILAHDCALDVPLSLYSTENVDRPDLLATMWAEHFALLRDGAKSRRRIGRLSSKVKIGIAAGVAVVVVGTAVGLLLANVLRDHRVVLKVSP